MNLHGKSILNYFEFGNLIPLNEVFCSVLGEVTWTWIVDQALAASSPCGELHT